MTEFKCDTCGKPAKYSMTSLFHEKPRFLCGIHARKHIKAQKPWQKITELKPTK